jgi:hypothetical protein
MALNFHSLVLANYMTTIIPFLPSNIFPPKFRIMLDGIDYQVVVTWNISAQRYYVNIYGLDNSWIITVPLVQTPPARPMQSITYDNLRRVIIAKMTDPTTWPVPLSSAGLLTPPGTIIDYTLENFDPVILNARWRSLQVDVTTFSFPLDNNPGEINILGTVSRYIDLVGGLFNSTFIYRNGAFEVNP